ncbi:MAG: hypothetical protein CM15mP12_7460 [Gammaproteobacteria bacterium]|nr:MAG: hypothetical protein CM15mP12_7460 [Gammaproteobacteria bacterium]
MVVVLQLQRAGAVGIAMGTRFMMTEESPVPKKNQEAYLNAKTRILRSENSMALPHRLIFNDFIKKRVYNSINFIIFYVTKVST